MAMLPMRPEIPKARGSVPLQPLDLAPGRGSPYMSPCGPGGRPPGPQAAMSPHCGMPVRPREGMAALHGVS